MTQASLQFTKQDLVVSCVDGDDARRKSDDLRTLRQLVVSNEQMYPNIDRWFDQKVIPGLISAHRVAYIGMVDGRAIASAVVKRGPRSKFCHLRVEPEFQAGHLGELFFALMASGVRPFADEVHFTLPESLWEERHQFFESFGFSERHEAGTQYRLFEQELRCSAPFKSVWAATLAKLPKLISQFSAGGFALDSSLLLSIRPKWAHAILAGTKTVEFRRSFSNRWEGHRAALYATHPTQSLVGEARIGRVTSGPPARIWMEHGHSAGCGQDLFETYTAGAPRVFAIQLEEVRRFPQPLSLSVLASFLGEQPRPPQSYSRVSSRTAWGRGVSIAALLNANGAGALG